MKSKQFFMRVHVCACVHDSFFAVPLLNIIYVCIHTEMLSLFEQLKRSSVEFGFMLPLPLEYITVYTVSFFIPFRTRSLQYQKQSNSESEISADVVSFSRKFRNTFGKVCFEKKIQKICGGCKWRWHSEKCVYKHIDWMRSKKAHVANLSLIIMCKRQRYTCQHISP